MKVYDVAQFEEKAPSSLASSGARTLTSMTIWRKELAWKGQMGGKKKKKNKVQIAIFERAPASHKKTFLHALCWLYIGETLIHQATTFL